MPLFVYNQRTNDETGVQYLGGAWLSDNGVLSYVVATDRQEPDVIGKAIKYLLPGLLAPLDPGDVQKIVVYLKQTGTGTVSATLRDQAMEVAIPLMPRPIPFAVVLKDETSHPDYSEIELVTRPSFLAAIAEADERLRSSLASYMVQVFRPVLQAILVAPLAADSIQRFPIGIYGDDVYGIQDDAMRVRVADKILSAFPGVVATITFLPNAPSQLAASNPVDEFWARGTDRAGESAPKSPASRLREKFKMVESGQVEEDSLMKQFYIGGSQ